jgi:hypothetical protein
MLQNTEAGQPEALANNSRQADKKMKSDVLVLRYMIQRIHTHIQNPAAASIQPSTDYAIKKDSRVHRIALCRQRETFLAKSLTFVGFISGIRDDVSPATIQELHKVDRLLITELANHQGILSYSSLELSRDRWYNLVLLSGHSAKAHFRDSGLHGYASYRLAPHYYAWIRLHNGVIPGGLNCEEMVIRSTKYYTFSAPGQQPIVQEVFYKG